MTFFEKSVLDKSGCLYYLLPPQRDVWQTLTSVQILFTSNKNCMF